jgi:hypothetical protein
MKIYALDTNCFINAVNPTSHSYPALRAIIDAAEKGVISLKVSLQTLRELEEKEDAAWKLAKSQSELAHHGIGSRDEQVGTWKQDAGTWDDANRDDAIQLELRALAKAGNDIRDRGAYIDALSDGLDGFVTSDKQLVGTGPSSRINGRFSTKVLTPEQLATDLLTCYCK